MNFLRYIYYCSKEFLNRKVTLNFKNLFGLTYFSLPGKSSQQFQVSCRRECSLLLRHFRRCAVNFEWANVFNSRSKSLLTNPKSVWNVEKLF